MGNVYLEGSDRKIWSEPNLDDMVTLVPQAPEENFTTELTVRLIHQYNRLVGRHLHVWPQTLLSYIATGDIDIG